MTKDNKTKILFSKMYIGRYNVDNIGHEIINFYKPDDGEESFIFNPDKGEGASDVDHVILLGPSEKYAYPILAIALGVTKVDNSLASKIKYGGKVLEKIGFNQSNIISDKPFCHVTYQVPSGNLKKPPKKTYIVPAVNKRFKEKQQNKIKELESKNFNVIVLENEKPGRSFFYGYCGGDSNQNSQLNKLIVDAKNFKNFKLLKVDLTAKGPEINNKSFMHFIGKEHSEQAFTNMFYNILNSGNENDRKDNRKAFVNWLLKKCNRKDYNLSLQGFEIAKEKSTTDTSHKGRLDLLLYNEDYIVIIENKINSLLNGIYEEENVKHSQLDKYKEFAKKIKANNENFKNAKILTFLFVPNYSELSELKDSDKYVVVTYYELYKYFKDFENKQTNIPSSYYGEFLNGLLLHSLTREQEINRRFLSALNKHH